MNCDQALELLSAMLDGELDGDALAELNAHLDVCPNCRALYADLKTIQTDLLDGMEDLPDGFHDRVMAAVAEEPLPKAGNKRRTRRMWATLAAAAAVAVLAVLPQTNFGWMGSSGGGADSNGAAPMLAQAPAGGAEAYSMEDGAEAYSVEGGAALENSDSGMNGRSMEDQDALTEHAVADSPQEDALATEAPEPMPAAAPEAPASFGPEAVVPTSNDSKFVSRNKTVLTAEELPEGYAWGEDGTLELPLEELPALEAALAEAGIPYDVEGGAGDTAVLVIRLD